MEMSHETFDFIIVGSGGGSMCAALVVKAMEKKPLILEKTDLFGGTTAKSGGVMWIPNNRLKGFVDAKLAGGKSSGLWWHGSIEVRGALRSQTARSKG